MIKNVYSGSPWEKQVAYSRARRIGPMIAVSGTVAADGQGAVVGAGDAYAQTRFILQKIERALIEAGATLRDVVRTRIYLANMGHFAEVGRAHKEVFEGIDPATSAIQVAALINEAMLVEIEVDAYLE